MTEEMKRRFKEAILETQDPQESQETPDPPSINQTLNGNGIQVAGNVNGTINYNQPEPVTKVVAVTKPGVEHITEEQKANLTALVREIVSIEKAIKRKPATYSRVWGGVDAHVKVSSYSLIPLNKYDKALKYLQKWRGRLNAAPSARKKNPNWRKSQYTYIQTNVKMLGMKDRMRAHIAEKFGVESLKELNDIDLKKVYNTVSSWKQTASNKK